MSCNLKDRISFYPLIINEILIFLSVIFHLSNFILSLEGKKSCQTGIDVGRSSGYLMRKRRKALKPTGGRTIDENYDNLSEKKNKNTHLNLINFTHPFTHFVTINTITTQISNFSLLTLVKESVFSIFCYRFSV